MQPAMKAKQFFFVSRLAFLAAFLWAFSASGFAQQSAPPELPSTQPSQASSGAPSEFAQARKLMQQGKLDEAIAELQTLEARDPAAKGPQNDKGIYAIANVEPRMTIRNQDVITWSSFKEQPAGQMRVGFMSQISPDGQYVVTTVGAEKDIARNR